MDSIDDSDQLHLKLPLCLSPYAFQYMLKLEIDVDPDDSSKECIQCCSALFAATVPCLTLDHSYQPGDVIFYNIAGAMCGAAGEVTKILPKHRLRIKSTTETRPEFGELLDMDARECIPWLKPNEDIVDLTDRSKAEMELILHNGDSANQETFDTMCQALAAVCWDHVVEPLMVCMTHYDPGRDGEFMAHFIALGVCRFLFRERHKYRLGCAEEGGFVNIPKQQQMYSSLGRLATRDMIDSQFLRTSYEKTLGIVK